MSDPAVTIVVSPRERFSFAERSLSNIYEQTTVPFKLIYVSGRTPPPVRRYLELESEQKGFQFLYIPNYLSPNQARNLGLSVARTKYIVFLDNDALVTSGWLDALVRCAEETGAWVVGPLYLVGDFPPTTIHMAGGMLHVQEQEGKRFLCDEQYCFETPIAEVTEPLRRLRCDYMEFHCMLVRTEVFEKVGPLDEKLLSLHEERDFCLTVGRAGGSIYIEPKAVITYVPPPPYEWWDLPYFMLRWSEAWNLASVRHFNSKWGIAGIRHISDKTHIHQEGTILGFARAWRRRIAGLRLPSGSTGDHSGQPSDQAELMIAMFESVDRDCFELALTTGDGRLFESASSLIPHEILERLPGVMSRAEDRKLNVMIHPVHQARDHEPYLIRLDNLSAQDLSRVRRYAFMTLETEPHHYQCWIAVDKKNWQSLVAASGLALTAEASGNHFVSLAGIKSVECQDHQVEGRYFRVKLVEAVAGLLATARQLNSEEIRPLLLSSHIY